MQTRTIRIDLDERERKDAAASRRFPVSVSSETPVPRRDWQTGQTFSEILSHAKDAVDLSRGDLPVLEGHDRSKTNIGIVRGLRVDGTKLRGELVLGASQRAGELAADIGAGIVSGLSVGYTVDVEERDEQAKKITARKWTPYEVSIVPIPADSSVGINRSAPMSNEIPVVNPTPAPADLSTRAQPDAGDLLIREERLRVDTIRSLCTKQELGSEFAERLVRENIPLGKAREAILDALATRSDSYKTESHVRVEGGESSIEKFNRGAEASLLERAGVADLVAEAAKTKVGASLRTVASDPGEFRGWKMEELAREFLERSGMKTRGWGSQRVFEKALSVRSGMAGTSDFPVLLENTLGKTLLAAYATQPTAWPKFCGKVNVPDFKAASFFRNGSFGTLSPINEHGEYTNKAIPDGEKSSISIGAYGNIIAITRKALIDDDLGSFTDLAQRFGASAARTIEAAVFALLAQNAGLGPTLGAVPLFAASRANIGTGAAISVASLDSDAALMAAQKDPSGNDYLDLRPAVLIVPHTLRGQANVLNSSQFDPDAANKLQKPNMVVGLYREIVATPRLSGTRRYSFADPSVARCLAVGFLNGAEAPTVQSQDGWRVDGTELKVSLDFGVAAMDWRGCTTNSGATEPG
jgi:HK97 family phage prohead protease